MQIRWLICWTNGVSSEHGSSESLVFFTEATMWKWVCCFWILASENQHEGGILSIRVHWIKKVWGSSKRFCLVDMLCRLTTGTAYTTACRKLLHELPNALIWDKHPRNAVSLITLFSYQCMNACTVHGPNYCISKCARCMSISHFSSLFHIG